MPSVRYYNQTAPFWDFVASLEEQGASHPFFSGNHRQANAGNDEPDNNAQSTNPWTDGWAGGFPFAPGAWTGSFPHRGRFGPPHGHPNGPPRGPHHEHRGPPPPPPAGDHDMPDPPEQVPGEGSSSEPRGPPPPFTEKPSDANNNNENTEAPEQSGPGSQHHRRGGCGPRGGCRGRGGMRGGPGAWGRPFHHHRGGSFPGPMGGFGALAEMFQSQLFGDSNSAAQDRDSASFTPDVDVFDTPSAFIIHVSLPGVKKEDIGVNYDPEKSELSIAGVSYRPADEELLNHLAMDERRVGMFERKVRLGSRANPAQVDIEGISAKLEEGILRVEVSKVVPEEEEFVQVRKVDIE